MSSLGYLRQEGIQLGQLSLVQQSPPRSGIGVQPIPDEEGRLLGEIFHHPLALPSLRHIGEVQPSDSRADLVDHADQAGPHFEGGVEDAARPPAAVLEPAGQAQGQFGLAHPGVAGKHHYPFSSQQTLQGAQLFAAAHQAERSTLGQLNRGTGLGFALGGKGSGFLHLRDGRWRVGAGLVDGGGGPVPKYHLARGGGPVRVIHQLPTRQGNAGRHVGALDQGLVKPSHKELSGRSHQGVG